MIRISSLASVLLMGSLALPALAASPASPATPDLHIGKRAPNFNLPDQDGRFHRLSQYRGHTVILAFYPKDRTAG